MNRLTIGELAEQANVPVGTLRYYERRGSSNSRRGAPRMTGSTLTTPCAGCASSSGRRSSASRSRTSRSSSPFEPPLQPGAERFAGMQKPKSWTLMRRFTPSWR
jgi:hypothetical protein